MTLIICEKYRIARAVARSLKATTRLHFGVFTNKEITVAFVRKNFITLTPLSEMAGGRVPFIPAKYKMQVTDKSTDRRLRRLFRTAKEVVFASGEGGEAQARFFNLCRHFRVGQPTSRMWLTQLDHEAIKPIFAKREKGRVLHNLAQCGLSPTAWRCCSATISVAFLTAGITRANPSHDRRRLQYPFSAG